MTAAGITPPPTSTALPENGMNKPSFNEKLHSFKQQLKEYDDHLPFSKQKALINRHLLSPVVITTCNGDGPWCFTSATMTFNYWFGIPLYTWYNRAIKKVCAELKMKGYMNTEQKQAFEYLLDFFHFGKHLTCLKTLLEDHNKSEHEVQAILAMHLFSPLVHPHSYAVDKYAFPKHLRCCPSCKEPINLENTSFGNREVWSGNADIVIRRSVIKVNLEERVIQDLGCGDTSVLTDTDDIGEEPVNKRAKISCESMSEDSQSLAQTIVNSFCEAKKKKSLFNCFIPSFMSTEKHIQINFYGVEPDILLSSEELPIWHSSNTLDISTVIYIWLSLNFDRFEYNFHDFVCKKFPKSGFQKHVKDKYPVYLEQVSRPLPDKTDIIEDKRRLYFEDIMNYPEVVRAMNETMAEAEDREIYAT